MPHVAMKTRNNLDSCVYFDLYRHLNILSIENAFHNLIIFTMSFETLLFLYSPGCFVSLKQWWFIVYGVYGNVGFFQLDCLSPRIHDLSLNWKCVLFWWNSAMFTSTNDVRCRGQICFFSLTFINQKSCAPLLKE